jgi:hypothetical protein
MDSEDVLHSVKEERNWIGHILGRNLLVKRVIGGKIDGAIEMMERRGRIRKQLLDDLKETRGYWRLKV